MSTGLTLDRVQAMRGGKPLSQPITLTAAPGSILALVGPNGVGKSTLLAAIARTGIAHTGSVLHDDHDLATLNAPRRARHISLLAQDSRGTEELRVRELVEIGARAGGPLREIGARTQAALEEIGVVALADRRLGTLSGGQCQLAQLARVAAQRAPVVLLDEPAAALDLGHQVLVERVVSRFASQGRIVVAAVHDLSFALTIATSVLLLTPTGEVHHGHPRDVLTPDRIAHAYGVDTSVITTPAGRTLLALDEIAPLASRLGKEPS